MDPTTVLFAIVVALGVALVCTVAWYERRLGGTSSRLNRQQSAYGDSLDLLHRLKDLEAQRGDVWDQSRDLYRETVLATGFDPDLDWQGCRQRRVELDELIDGPPRPLAGPAPRNVIGRTHNPGRD